MATPREDLQPFAMMRSLFRLGLHRTRELAALGVGQNAQSGEFNFCFRSSEHIKGGSRNWHGPRCTTISLSQNLSTKGGKKPSKKRRLHALSHYEVDEKLRHGLCLVDAKSLFDHLVRTTVGSMED